MRTPASLLVIATCAFASSLAAEFSIAASSWLGGSESTDQVVGAHILPSGEVVLAANLGGQTFASEIESSLGSASSTSAGALLLLSPDGQSLLKVVRIADTLYDLDTDGAERLYVAANSGAIVVLPDLSAIAWSAPTGGIAVRVDAAGGGMSAFHHTSNVSSDTLRGGGTAYLFAADGSSLGTLPGMQETQDIALDDELGLLFQTGFRNAHSGANPVQVAYLRAIDLDGNVVWLNYAWPATWLDNHHNDGWDNLMADTRGYRMSLGEDGKLYVTFESAGGNHIISRMPAKDDLGDNLKTRLPSERFPQSDKWHQFWNTKSEHKLVLGRYEPATGEALLVTQYLTRHTGNKGNALRAKGGQIIADADGTVYIGSSSASGLPIPGTRDFSNPRTGDQPFNPFDHDVYTGGAYFTILTPDFQRRAYVTRLSGGVTRAIATREIDGVRRVVWGGNAGRLRTEWFSGGSAREWLLHTINPLQAERGGGDREGFFAMIADGEIVVSTCSDIDILAIYQADGEMVVDFRADAGISVQVQSAPSPGGPWMNEGSAVTATGASQPLSLSLSEDRAFFRLTCE